MHRQSFLSGLRPDLIGVVILLGILPRLVGLYRPTPAYLVRPTTYSTPSTWHEADYVQIARSFLREDIDPLRPRVDWRGTTTGEVEMELPVLPWLGALGYRIAGYHEWILRWLSAACGVGALIVFSRLARRMLEPSAALVACAAFAVHPLALALSSSMQPEPLQLLLLCVAGLAIERWQRIGGTRALLVASAWIAAAILAKSPSACLGLLLAYLVIRRQGLRAVRDPKVLGPALLALLPPLLWYGWAHSIYTRTGLSLGVSNETHFLSWIMIRHPGWVLNLAWIESSYVFALAALPLVVCAAFTAWQRVEVPVMWYLAVVAFYVITADTSADGWAFYYHVQSVVPVCLLLGFGYAALRARFASGARRWTKLIAAALALAALAGLGLRALMLQREIRPEADFQEFRRACLELAPQVPPDALLVVRGGGKYDEHGHPVAYNEPVVFAWMDRKGLNYPVEDYSFDELLRLARQHRAYWLAQPADFDEHAYPGLRAQVERTFPRVASSGNLNLYRLEAP